MIKASEAREIMYNALKVMYKEVVGDISRRIIERSEEGYSYMQYRVSPDFFELHGDELITLLKESGYHVSKASEVRNFTYFMISWKEESPFYEEPPEQPRWWKFWE